MSLVSRARRWVPSVAVGIVTVTFASAVSELDAARSRVASIRALLMPTKQRYEQFRGLTGDGRIYTIGTDLLPGSPP